MADIRTIIFWLIGTTCIFFGSLIAGSVAPVVGSTGVSNDGIRPSLYTYNVGWDVLDINSHSSDGRRGIIS